MQNKHCLVFFENDGGSKELGLQANNCPNPRVWFWAQIRRGMAHSCTMVQLRPTVELLVRRLTLFKNWHCANQVMAELSKRTVSPEGQGWISCSNFTQSTVFPPLSKPAASVWRCRRQDKCYSRHSRSFMPRNRLSNLLQLNLLLFSIGPEKILRLCTER